MILASPPSSYDKSDQAQMRDALRRADDENHKRGRDVEIGTGRVILTSANGDRWQVVVSNTGTLSCTAI